MEQKQVRIIHEIKIDGVPRPVGSILTVRAHTAQLLTSMGYASYELESVGAGPRERLPQVQPKETL